MQNPAAGEYRRHHNVDPGLAENVFATEVQHWLGQNCMRDDAKQWREKR
jgi:hypothetical protein